MLDKLLQGIDELANTQIDNLIDPTYVANVIRRIGLFDDGLKIYDCDMAHVNVGDGIWQSPQELAEALISIRPRRPQSYFEVGTFNGWTTSVITAYLRRFNSRFFAITVDPYHKFTAYDEIRKILPISYLLNATSDLFTGLPFDLCFIDGDHSYEWISKDYNNVGKFAETCMFHDIVPGGPCTGVKQFWDEVKVGKNALEIICNSRYLGIGLIKQ
jgi:hypothetical protein